MDITQATSASGQNGFRRPLTTQEAVLRELRRTITAGELRPGEHVLQEEVADRLGVSRVPVREALKVLTAEGQVSYEAHRGYWVTELSVEELRELYLMRRLLETEALRWAVPRVDAQDIKRLWALNEALEAVCANGDFLGVMELDREFHLALFEKARLPRLLKTIRLLWQNSEPYRGVFLNALDSRRRARREHRAILKACEDGDVESVIVALDLHRENAIADLAVVLDGETATNR